MDAFNCDVDILSLNTGDTWMDVVDGIDVKKMVLSEPVIGEEEDGQDAWYTQVSNDGTNPSSSSSGHLRVLSNHIEKSGEEWTHALRDCSFAAEGETAEPDWRRLICPHTAVEASHSAWCSKISDSETPKYPVVAIVPEFVPRALQQKMQSQKFFQQEGEEGGISEIAKAMNRRSSDARDLRRNIAKLMRSSAEPEDAMLLNISSPDGPGDAVGKKRRKPAQQQHKFDMPAWLKIAKMPSGQYGIVNEATGQVLAPAMPGAPALGTIHDPGVSILSIPDIPRAMFLWRQLPGKPGNDQILVRTSRNKKVTSKRSLVAIAHPPAAAECQVLTTSPILIPKKDEHALAWPVANVVVDWKDEACVVYIDTEAEMGKVEAGSVRLWMRDPSVVFGELYIRDAAGRDLCNPLHVTGGAFMVCIPLRTSGSGKWEVLTKENGDALDGVMVDAVRSLAPLVSPTIKYADNVDPVIGEERRVERVEEMDAEKVLQTKRTMIAKGCAFSPSLSGMQVPGAPFDGARIPHELLLSAGLDSGTRAMSAVGVSPALDIELALQLLACRGSFLTWSTSAVATEEEEEEEGGGGVGGKKKRRQKKDYAAGGSLANTGMEAEMLPCLTQRVKIETMRLTVAKSQKPDALYNVVAEEAKSKDNWAVMVRFVHQWLLETTRGAIPPLDSESLWDLGERVAQVVCTSQQLSDAAKEAEAGCGGVYFIYAMAYAARPIWLYSDGNRSNMRDFSTWMQLGTVVADLFCSLAVNSMLNAAASTVGSTEPLILGQQLRPYMRYIRWLPQPLQSYVRLSLCYRVGEMAMADDGIGVVWGGSLAGMTAEARKELLMRAFEYNTVKNDVPEFGSHLFRALFWKTMVLPALRVASPAVNAWLAFAESMGGLVRPANHYFMRAPSQRSGGKGRDNRRKWCRRIPGSLVVLQDCAGACFSAKDPGAPPVLNADYLSKLPEGKLPEGTTFKKGVRGEGGGSGGGPNPGEKIAV